MGIAVPSSAKGISRGSVTYSLPHMPRLPTPSICFEGWGNSKEVRICRENRVLGTLPCSPASPGKIHLEISSSIVQTEGRPPWGGSQAVPHSKPEFGEGMVHPPLRPPFPSSFSLKCSSEQKAQLSLASAPCAWQQRSLVDNCCRCRPAVLPWEVEKLCSALL